MVVGDFPFVSQAISRTEAKVEALYRQGMSHWEAVLDSRCGHSGDACHTVLQQELEETYLELSPTPLYLQACIPSGDIIALTIFQM